jgi:nicotinate-nucleotide pyrophosphorylase
VDAVFRLATRAFGMEMIVEAGQRCGSNRSSVRWVGGVTGVDLISAGWLTHSTTALDIGLDYAANAASHHRRIEPDEALLAPIK